MRIVAKQRRISKKTAAAHLRWNSDVHKRDQVQADALRATAVVSLPISREPFPEAEAIAVQYLYERTPEGGLKPQKKEDDFESSLAKLARKKSFYLYETPSGKEMKRKSKGITDTYISLPPWWSKSLADAVKQGTLTAEQVRSLLANLGHKCLSALAKKTGYEPVYFAVHPDSQNNMHIHLGVSSISDEHKLIGRSATGKKGKKGLRHLGDCNLALYRMSKIQPDKTNAIGLRKAVKGVDGRGQVEFDDKFLADLLDSELERTLPGMKPMASRLAKEHVASWVEKARQKQLNHPNEVERLRTENKALQGQVSDLKQEVKALNEYILATDSPAVS